MIPRHEPPFGLCDLLSAAWRDASISQAALETYCAEKFGVEQALLFPSARSAILAALRAMAPSVDLVVGPAYTCDVVHQAMRLSGLPTRFVDCQPDSYLMSVDELRGVAARPAAIVLSEIYGLRYGDGGLAPIAGPLRHARIWDMAMCVPEPSDFCRLGPGDAAVLSFGLGKCLYAGWGGLLLTRSSELASAVGELRRQIVTGATRKARLRHGAEVLAHVAAHNRLLYGTGRQLAEWRNRHASNSSAAATAAAVRSDCAKTELSREWTEPMTPLNRNLAQANLRRTTESRAIRRRKAAAYVRCLATTGLVHGVDEDMLPESHFPIRVAAAARHSLRRCLARRGIDTATYFCLPGGLNPTDYPNAARAASEIVLLPLGRCIREDEIETVAEQVTAGLRMANGPSNRNAD